MEVSIHGQTSFRRSSRACCWGSFGRLVVAQSFGPFWRFGSKCNPLGFRPAIDRQFLAAPDGGRSKPLEAPAGMVLTVKKKTAHASEQERSDVVAAREVWRQMQQGLNPGQLVFLDESGVKTNMARRCGRSKKGKRLVASIPHGHWKSLTFIAGLRADRIDAPWVLDRAMNGDAFLTCLREILGPTLAKGDTVIMDNLSTHKVTGVREAIEATGAKLLYLPPYSPDLNPI